MNISIEEIVINMDLYKKKCFDTVACKIVDFQNQDGKRYIELPEFNEIEIIKAYIDAQKYIHLDGIRKVDNDIDLMDVFHRKINDLKLYDDWVEYRENYLYHLAEKWYKGNVKFM